MNDHDSKQQDPVPHPPQQKQPYTPPVLRVEGDIEKLTQNLGLNTADGIASSGII